MGVVKVSVSDHQGSPRSLRLPFIGVPSLGRHVYSVGTARKQRVWSIFSELPHLDVAGNFQIPLQQDNICDTLFQFDLRIASDSVSTEHAFPTVSGFDLPPAHATVAIITASSTAAAGAGASTASSATAAGARASTTPSPGTAMIAATPTPAFLPTADIAGEIEIENRPDFRDVASINDCVILLEGADNSSSPVVQQQPEGKISTRLRSSGILDQPQQDGTNSRQARALRRLKLATAAAAQFTFDSYTEYIGTVGIEGVLPPAAVETPNTIKEARRSPQSPEWELHLREPHHPD